MTSLSDANAGERVIHRDGYSVERVVLIERTTPTQILIAGATAGTYRRFWRNGGQEVGRSSGYHISRIEPGTPERIQQVKDNTRRAWLAERFQHRNWANLPLAKLEEVELLLMDGKVSATLDR